VKRVHGSVSRFAPFCCAPREATPISPRSFLSELSRTRTGAAGFYADLIAFSPIMTQVDPDLVADLAQSELLEELPKDKLIREQKQREEHYKHLAELRAIPEEKRTRQQNLALQSVFFPIGSDRYDLDDIGIDRHNNVYFPTSALHEPFKSLFANKPRRCFAVGA